MGGCLFLYVGPVSGNLPEVYHPAILTLWQLELAPAPHDLAWISGIDDGWMDGDGDGNWRHSSDVS